VPDSAAEGLCTRCLLAAAATPTEAGQPTGTRPTAPPLERVVVAFPHLEILELIGVGGMGAVFKARQPKLERYVALKVLPEALARDPAFAERFQREGRVLARLNHPNIVTVHDFGQSGDFFYLLMEYVDGVNLRQAMRAGRFTPAQALALVPRICEALQFAHDEGVLHRDIKPENILLDARGRVKIADFGIAKLLGETRADVSLTATGAAIGTPQYMAPEQIERPTEVDHRADIYSLGVVFYELLTGELPLGRFAPPSAKTDLDARIDEIVLRALTKERELRQQSAREVKTEVEGVTARGVATPVAAAAVSETARVAPLWQLPLLARQSIRALLVLLLACWVYRVVSHWLPYQRMMVSSLTQNWLQALVAGTGIILVLELGILLWWRRTVWWAPLRLPATSDVTHRWLQALLGGLLVCLGFDIAHMILALVQMFCLPLVYGEFGKASLGLAFLLITMAPLGWLVRQELRRRDQIPQRPLPDWAQRVAAGLILTALASQISHITVGFGGPETLTGYGDILGLISVALWSGSRLWRAVALALSVPSFLLGTTDAAWLLTELLQGKALESSGELPIAQTSTMFAVAQTLGFLAVVAGLATLLNPAVRAAFGLPPRRRSRAGAVAPRLASAA
jgi:serine/threonine protein kinase